MLESLGHSLRSRLFPAFAAAVMLATSAAVARVPAARAPGTGEHAAATAGPSCDGRQARGDVSVTVPFGGRDYRVGVYVPDGYDDTSPAALVLNLHGSDSDGPAQMAITGMRATADRHDFVVAAPEGGIAYPGSRTGRAWHIPGVPLYGGHALPSRPRDDVAFVSAALDVLTRELCVDPGRVYATGFSGGGRMTSLLGCRLADRIAAIAPVAGVRAGSPDPAAVSGGPRPDCRPRRAVPVLSFHGRQDRANPYDGDRSRRWRYSVPRAMETWARLDGCDDRPRRTATARRVERLTWSGCRDGAEVTLYVAADAGHTWPGSTGPDDPVFGRVDRDTPANEVMWAFFARHRLPDD